MDFYYMSLNFCRGTTAFRNINSSFIYLNFEISIIFGSWSYLDSNISAYRMALPTDNLSAIVSDFNGLNFDGSFFFFWYLHTSEQSEYTISRKWKVKELHYMTCILLLTGTKDLSKLVDKFWKWNI